MKCFVGLTDCRRGTSRGTKSRRHSPFIIFKFWLTRGLMMFSCGDNNELLSWFCVMPQQLQWSIHLKWKRLHYSPLPVYLVCDWPRPGSCGCECERPPSPGQCESPESDNGRNAAAADATDRWQTAQTPPLWSLPPPREKSEGQKHGDGFGLTSQHRAALLSFHWTTTHRSLCALQWPLTSAETVPLHTSLS